VPTEADRLGKISGVGMADRTTTSSERISQILMVMKEVALLVDELGYGAYIVGGAVRDMLSAYGPEGLLKDLDIAIVGDARVVGRMLAAKLGARVTVHDRFLTANLIFSHLPFDLDLTTARTEQYDRPGNLPTVSPATIEEDLARRDFTVNAMALPLWVVIDLLLSSQFNIASLSSEILDPFQGKRDLESRSIHVLHPRSFTDDPTRLFRALRYAVRLSGGLSGETSRLFAEAVSQPVLQSVSVNRILTEVRKGLTESDAPLLITRMFETGLLSSALDLRPSSSIANLEATVGSIVGATTWDFNQRWVVLMGFFFWAGMASNNKVESAVQIQRPIVKQLFQIVERSQGDETFPHEAVFSGIAWSK
jgi:tRNA nucleotidyltransferase/poly(A) polymerase